MDLTYLYREKPILISTQDITLHIPGFIFSAAVYTKGLRYGQVGCSQVVLYRRCHNEFNFQRGAC